MKIGLSTLYLLGRPFSHLLKELNKVDVGNIEIVDEGPHALNSRRVRAIKKIVEDRGLQVTVHGPFVDVNPASPTASLRKAGLNLLKRSIRFSSQLGSSVWVFHPGLQTGVSHFCPGLDWKLNLRSVRELLVASRKCGVKIAIENTPDPYPFLLKNVEDFDRFFEALGKTDLGITLDVGHANINGQIFKFIERFPHRIVHAHLHDNHGELDEHLGIGTGKIKWPKIINAFKEMKYEGTLIVESEKNVQESLLALMVLLQGI